MDNPKYARQTRYFRRLKVKVVTHYSNGTMACANPFGEHKRPYTTIEALSIDHIYGKGAKQRKELGWRGKGVSFYLWLIKQGYPKGYQVLCMNCQWIKRSRNDES
jgi:hypothetical protein